jgi:hypothetical protein
MGEMTDRSSTYANIQSIRNFCRYCFRFILDTGERKKKNVLSYLLVVENQEVPFVRSDDEARMRMNLVGREKDPSDAGC